MSFVKLTATAATIAFPVSVPAVPVPLSVLSMAPGLVAFPVAISVAVSVAVPVFTIAVAVAREVVAIAAVAVCKKNEGKSNGEYTLRFSSWGGSVASLVQVYEARTMAGRADSELASCKK